jgi:excinuclease ABC subunit C
MKSASVKQDYEKAALLRDLLFAIRKTLEPSRKFISPPLEKKQSAMALVHLLAKAINLTHLPREIECFDISHISGTFVVASMVHFTNGAPDKNKYRRYKIRNSMGNDDYRAMQEVVARRYSRLHRENALPPDLIVIDGGKGQVNAALSAFLAHELPPPVIIGLAKKRETIVFSDERPHLNLPLNNPALHLLQRIRDEAHRFANSFNAQLRSKKIRESVLDNFSGLGPVRKEALLKHFKTIGNLRKATPKQLQEIPGIGPKIAQELYSFLQKN